MVSVVCVNQILHDGPRFEQANPAAVGVDVCQRWEATVGVELEEPGFLVSILGGIDLVKVVGQSVDWDEQSVQKAGGRSLTLIPLKGWQSWLHSAMETPCKS